MPTRLDQLNDELAELLSTYNNERSELGALAAREDDFDEATTARFRALETRFDVEGRWADQDKVDQLRAQISRLSAVANAPVAAHEPVGLTLHMPNTEDTMARNAEWGRPQEVFERGLRAIDKGLVEVDDNIRAAMTHTLRTTTGNRADLAARIIMTGREAYRSGFQKVLAAMASGTQPFGLTAAENEALDAARALSVGTASAGGYAVPVTLDPTIILTGAHNGEFVGSFWRQAATVKTTMTNTWNGVTSAGVTANWYAEGGEVSDDSPTLANPGITPKRASAFVPFSVEIEGDWASMESDIRMMIAVAKDDLEADAFASAVAITNGPDGLIYGLDGTAAEITPTTAETFAVADIYKLIAAVPARFRSRSSWLGNVATYGAVRQFDTAGGSNLWAQLAADRPGVLLGRPAYEVPQMRASTAINAAATADNFILVFGDIGQYYIVDRVGMSVELVPHLFGTNRRPTGQRGFFAWWRTGAKVIDSSALAVLNVATTA